MDVTREPERTAAVYLFRDSGGNWIEVVQRN